MATIQKFHFVGCGHMDGMDRKKETKNWFHEVRSNFICWWKMCSFPIDCLQYDTDISWPDQQISKIFDLNFLLENQLNYNLQKDTLPGRMNVFSRTIHLLTNDISVVFFFFGLRVIFFFLCSLFQISFCFFAIGFIFGWFRLSER